MHQEFLCRLLAFKAGVPSHDIINAIDGALFTQCFTAWVESLHAPVSDDTTPEVIAINGKTSRRTHDCSKHAASMQ